MVNKYLLLNILLAAIVMCASCKKVKDLDNRNDIKSLINDTLILKEKQELRGEIFTLYPKLLTISFNSGSGTDYSEYNEFVEMQDRMSKYEKLPLNKEEIQRAGIFKAKIFILLSKYQEAIETLKALPEDEDFLTYKKLLISISKDYSNEINSNEAYDEIISILLNEKNVDCERYLMILVLSEKNGLKSCHSYREQYNFLINLGKDKLIEEYVLGVNEL